MGNGESSFFCVVSGKKKASEEGPEYYRAAVEVFLFLREQSCSFRFCFLASKGEEEKKSKRLRWWHSWFFWDGVQLPAVSLLFKLLILLL